MRVSEKFTDQTKKTAVPRHMQTAANSPTSRTQARRKPDPSLRISLCRAAHPPTRSATPLIIRAPFYARPSDGGGARRSCR